MQVKFVDATPSRENQVEMLTGPRARLWGAPGKGVVDVYAELDTASFFRWSMKTCRLTSSVRMGAPVSWSHDTNSTGSRTCQGCYNTPTDSWLEVGLQNLDCLPSTSSQ